MKEIGAPEKFEAFFAAPPRKGKVTPIGEEPSKQEHARAAGREKVAS